MKDVATQAGVSIATVSNVLHHPQLVSDDTAERVRSVMDQLGFVRNDAARILREGHSRTIGVSIPDISNPFFTDIVRAAEARAREHGLTVVLGNAGDDLEVEDSCLRTFSEQRVMGVLLAPVQGVPDGARRLRAAGVPVVLVDRAADEPQFESVASDDDHGGYVAVSHLLELGHRNILFAGGPDSVLQVRRRFDGASRAAAEQEGAKLTTFNTQSLTLEGGHLLGAHLRSLNTSSRPTAVFAANDLIALGLLQDLTAAHLPLRVPQDLSIVGYDDIAFAQAASVPLTTVRQPRDLIGRVGMDLLMGEASGASSTEHRLFEPQLILRESTGPRPDAARGTL